MSVEYEPDKFQIMLDKLIEKKLLSQFRMEDTCFPKTINLIVKLRQHHCCIKKKQVQQVSGNNYIFRMTFSFSIAI